MKKEAYSTINETKRMTEKMKIDTLNSIESFKVIIETEQITMNNHNEVTEAEYITFLEKKGNSYFRGTDEYRYDTPFDDWKDTKWESGSRFAECVPKKELLLDIFDSVSEGKHKLCYQIGCEESVDKKYFASIKQ